MPIGECRSCRSSDLTDILSLGRMPLANALLTDDQLGSEEPRYPLEVTRCAGCGLLQLTETVPPTELFVEYAYFSSRSAPMVDHARSLVGELVAERGLGGDDLVVEIASNDGYLLQHYVERGIPVLGIDPAANVAEVAIQRGIPTRCDFFTTKLAEELVAQGKQASVVHAHNVLAHVPDINDFVSAVAAMLTDDGVFVVETPYVRDMIEKLEFDTIYHEHVFYYSLRSMHSLFARNGLRIVRIERIPIHGGSLRVYATTDRSTESPHASVEELGAAESALGMDRSDFYEDFAVQVHSLVVELRDFLVDRVQQGRTIAGYGAAAKSTVLVNALGIGTETIGFVVDDTPYKQGRYLPGPRIPIRSPDALLEEIPDDVLIFAWNFAREIIDKESEYHSRGGTFLLPLPTPRVVT